MFDRGLRNFAQPGALVPSVSVTKLLRMKNSSGGTGVPVGALSGAGGLAILENPGDTKLAGRTSRRPVTAGWTIARRTQPRCVST